MVDQNQKLPTRFRSIRSYGGLAQGPNVTRTFNGAKSSPIDGTKQKLRDPRLGSPFTFRVAPPDILLDALMGGGEAQTDSAFDPFLRQAFNAAELNLAAVEEEFAAGQASEADVAAARQGLLGTRGPAQGQNIDIIEAAMKANTRFSDIVDRRNAFRDKSTFYAIGPERKGLQNIRRYIGSNGIEFDPENIGASEANQAAVSDLTQALSVILQLNRLLNTPPLTLLVNPQNLQINYTKKQQYQDRNRFNYIFQSWGEEQVRLSVSGRSAGFVVGAGEFNEFNVNEVTTQETAGGFSLDPAKTTNVSGYQWASKLDSAAWQNFMGMFQFYRNNGYIYDINNGPQSEAHLFIGTIEITYDQWVYVGNFENFSYSYDESKQHGGIEFSFDFVASSVFDRSKGGVSPVRPYDNPPTPSPGMSTASARPVLSDPAAKSARELPRPQGADPSTCILDPLCDPFAPPSEPTLEEVLGPGFRGTILRPTGGA